MAIPTPSIPSAIDSVGSVTLRPTLNNRAFYINSGLISVDNTETTIISINDIGKRDIIFCVNPLLTSDDGDNMTMKVKNNGSIIFQTVYAQQSSSHMWSPIHFIIPANTNIEITFQNADSTSHDVGVSCYGYYMEEF